MANELPRPKFATPDDVRAFLKLSDEQVTELQKEQAKALATFRSRARLTQKERQIGYAVEMEQHHRLTGNKDSLAEALAMQGRFAEAAETAEREDLKAVFAEKHNAIVKDDKDCDCPRHYEDGEYRLPNQHIESYLVSSKHNGRIMPAIRCKACGELNVRPILPHLAEQQEVRHSDKETKDFFRK